MSWHQLKLVYMLICKRPVFLIARISGIKNQPLLVENIDTQLSAALKEIDEKPDPDNYMVLVGFRKPKRLGL